MLKDLRQYSSNTPIVSEATLLDFKLPSELQRLLNTELESEGFHFDNYTAFAITDVARAEKPANYALIPNQYLVFACEMYEFANELYKYLSLFDKVRAHSAQLLGNSVEISERISSSELKDHFESEEDIISFSRFLDSESSEFRLSSKRLINDEGRPRGAIDCFSSVVLKKINLPDASSSIFGTLVYELCKNKSLYSALKSYYDGKKIPAASANVVITESSIRQFVFKTLKYLESSGEFKFLIPFLEEPNEHSNRNLKAGNSSVFSFFKQSREPLEERDLTVGSALRWENEHFFHDDTYFYVSNQWTNLGESRPGYRELNDFASILHHALLIRTTKSGHFAKHYFLIQSSLG